MFLEYLINTEFLTAVCLGAVGSFIDRTSWRASHFLVTAISEVSGGGKGSENDSWQVTAFHVRSRPHLQSQFSVS